MELEIETTDSNHNKNEMPCSYVRDIKPINYSLSSLQHIPLEQRRKFSHSDSRSPTSLQNDRRLTFTSSSSLDDAIVKKEHEDYDSQVTCLANKADARGMEKTSDLTQCATLCDVPATVKVEDSEILLSSDDKHGGASPQFDFPAPLTVKKEISEDNVDELDHIVLKERQRMLLARKHPELSNPAFEGYSGGLSGNILEQIVEKVYEKVYSHEEQDVMPINNDFPCSSTCPTSVKIKDEPRDNVEILNVNKDAMGSIAVQLPNLKSEWEGHNECHDDQVAHMSLIDRLNFLMAREDSSLNISSSYSSLKKTKPSFFMSSPIFSESAEPSRVKFPRKRKKTATDSVQTALEEDAPGLLQVLLDKGVLVDEIKLYGETENDDALDESSCEDSFSELEAVITKIFSQRHSFIKFPIIRTAKASKASYCLACLISLVEQTRYLKFRQWPVEWGWCRDLQSFIFVFERHNRIVLERPEYGYATYFFELVESLPVEWQIKRLVIAMKLTTCSRISLIENKELLVGEDLTEGEAKVLMEYGWTPNSGLGTMLNYRDRVVHDRKSEDISEWRSKIGKLLMDGYNGGTIVTPNIPKKVAEYRCAQTPSISPSSPICE